jgi:hypothetical protein
MVVNIVMKRDNNYFVYNNWLLLTLYSKMNRLHKPAPNFLQIFSMLLFTHLFQESHKTLPSKFVWLFQY